MSPSPAGGCPHVGSPGNLPAPQGAGLGAAPDPPRSFRASGRAQHSSGGLCEAWPGTGLQPAPSHRPDGTRSLQAPQESAEERGLPQALPALRLGLGRRDGHRVPRHGLQVRGGLPGLRGLLPCPPTAPGQRRAAGQGVLGCPTPRVWGRGGGLQQLWGDSGGTPGWGGGREAEPRADPSPPTATCCRTRCWCPSRC